jgi:hypothetical protein
MIIYGIGLPFVRTEANIINNLVCKWHKISHSTEKYKIAKYLLYESKEGERNGILAS